MAPPDTGLDNFSARLNQICDEKKLPARGRAELLSKKFGVTREAARKWLKALAYPTLAKRAEIAQWANVTDSWLVTGKGDKAPPTTRLTDHQRTAIDYMEAMTTDQQALAVRLLAQILDLPPEEHAAVITGRPQPRGEFKKSRH